MKSNDFIIVNARDPGPSTNDATSGLKVGSPSPANLWSMLSLLEERHPQIDWAIRLASEDIELSPVLRGKDMVGVRVARNLSTIYVNRAPFTIDAIKQMTPGLGTHAVEWEYDTKEAYYHDAICVGDICRCETIVNIGNPQIHLDALIDELATTFLVSAKDTPKRLAILARVWQFIEQNGGVERLGENCDVEAVSGYYGEELGHTSISKEWANGLIECVRDSLTLNEATARDVQLCAQQRIDIPLPMGGNETRAYKRIDLITDAIANAFPQVHAYPNYRNGNPLIYPDGYKFSLYATYTQSRKVSPLRRRALAEPPAALHILTHIDLPRRVQMWLHQKTDTPPTSIRVNAIAVDPARIFDEMNQILDQHLESSSIDL